MSDLADVVWVGEYAPKFRVAPELSAIVYAHQNKVTTSLVSAQSRNQRSFMGPKFHACAHQEHGPMQ